MIGSARVLVVGSEDAADTAATVESAAPEYTVDAATAPRAARERLAEATYDCAVVAGDPSTVDGAATVATVRETAPDVPVLLFADDTTGVDTEAIAAGAIDHVRSPTADPGEHLARRIEVAVATDDTGEGTADRLDSLQQLMRAVPAAITRVNREGDIVFANERAREVFGFDREEVVGREYDDPEWAIRDLDDEPIPPEDLPFRQVLDSGERVERYRHSIVWPDGTRRILEISGAPVFDEDGAVESVVFANRDVTERERRRTAFEALHDIATTIHREPTVEAVCERTVAAAADVLEFDTCTIVVREDDLLVPYAVSDEMDRSGSRPMRVDQGLAGKTIRTGESFVVDHVDDDDDADPAKDAFRSGMSVPIGEYGVFQAVSTEVAAFDAEDVEAAELLVSHAESRIEGIERERDLQRQNERLEEFASIVSHDLRNPLNVAAGRLELARQDADSDDLRVAGEAIERSQALIDDLLTLARTGEELGEVEPLGLPAVVEESWQSVETPAATLQVDAGGTVRADRTRLRQLFENLFRNSVEHGSTNPRSQAHDDSAEHAGADVTVTVGTLPDGFYVADDGPGIPADRRGDVFDAGYSTAEEGNGFGLRIVDQVVDAHGWSVAVTESAAGGARFEVTGVSDVE
jgi:two-component system OmpR family sensor kinase